MKALLFVVLVVFLGLTAYAQSGNIAGRVLNDKGQPVELANLQLTGSTSGTTTNSNGEYIISDVKAGEYTITVSFVGYESSTRTITVKSGESLTVNFEISATSNQLTEVIITAEKKEASIQRIPSSITALSSKDLEKTRTWSTNEITGLIPNMFVLSDGAMYMYLQSRGISSYSYDPVVQTYIDDVPLFTTQSLHSQLFDINRIEVLRGPQGTLYGRNAIGGVVNIVSNKPDNIFKGRGELSFGNYGQQRYSLALSSPIIKDKLFISSNGTFNSREGYTTNTNRNTKVDGNNSINGNVTLRYRPSDKWAFTINTRVDRFNSNGIGIASSYKEALANPYKIQHSSDPKLTRTLLNSSFVAKYYGDKVELTTVTAINYQTLKYGGIYDTDYTAANAYSYSYEKYGAPDKERNFYQEIRLNSSDKESSKVRWIAGGVFYKIRINRRYEYNIGVDSGDPDAPYTNITDAGENHHGFAGFGQVTYTPLAKLDITAGLRFDYEQKNLIQHTEFVKEPASPVVNPALKYTGDFDALSPRVSVAYRFTDKIMAYATYAKGFRAGGLNWGVTTPAYLTFGPEQSHNFEVGSKTTLLNDRIRFNTALFWLVYDNVQAFNYFGKDVSESGNVNAGTSTSKGMEAELTWILAKGLQLEESFGYTDAQYKDFTLYDFKVEGNVNYKNKSVQYTPKITNMTALQYSIPFETRTRPLVVSLRAEYRHIAKIYYSFDNTTSSPAYDIWNASVDIAFRNLDIKFWGRNLGEQVYFTSVYPWGGATWGTPRMYGATLVVKF